MPQTADQIQVACVCGKKLKAPASAAGKKAKCPGCGSVLAIPAASTASVPPPPVPAAPAKPKPKPAAKPAEEEVGLGALYELAAAEKHARVDDRPRCPQCVNELDPNAVVCMNCGFNLKTGKAIVTQKVAANDPKKSGGLFGIGKKNAPPAPGKAAVEDAMAPQGSFLMGVGGSAIGGAIGGAVWFLIAWFTGYELGFIALGVGALAGVGMQMGQKGFSRIGGVVAAGVAFLAIILAKVAVIAAVVMPALDDEGGFGSSNHDERVVYLVASDIAKAKGTTLEDMSFDDEEAAYKEADKRLDAMSPTEIQALTTRADEEEKKEELAEMVAEEMQQQQGGNADFKKYLAISAAAEKKVEAMTPAQRESERVRLEAKFEAEELEASKKAEAAAAAGEVDDSGDAEGSAGGAAVAAGFILLLLLLVGWKSILFLVIAMSLAYKTAAGSVSG